MTRRDFLFGALSARGAGALVKQIMETEPVEPQIQTSRREIKPAKREVKPASPARIAWCRPMAPALAVLLFMLVLVM